MSTPFLRIAGAVVAAGVAGTLLNAVAAALFVDSTRIGLALVPGRYAVAILVAVTLPLAFRLRDRWIAIGVSLLALTLAPSLIAKLVLGVGAAWTAVVGLNAVYAVAALLAYVLIAKVPPRAGRSGAEAELTDGNPSRLS